MSSPVIPKTPRNSKDPSICEKDEFHVMTNTEALERLARYDYAKHNQEDPVILRRVPVEEPVHGLINNLGKTKR